MIVSLGVFESPSLTVMVTVYVSWFSKSSSVLVDSCPVVESIVKELASVPPSLYSSVVPSSSSVAVNGFPISSFEPVVSGTVRVNGSSSTNSGASATSATVMVTACVASTTGGVSAPPASFRPSLTCTITE